MGEPMVVFNSYRGRPDAEPPDLASEDAVPGPMPRARLTEKSPFGRPGEYVAHSTYTGSRAFRPPVDLVAMMSSA